MKSDDMVRVQTGIQGFRLLTGPVTVMFDFVDHVPTRSAGYVCAEEKEKALRPMASE